MMLSTLFSGNLFDVVMWSLWGLCHFLKLFDIVLQVSQILLSFFLVVI